MNKTIRDPASYQFEMLRKGSMVTIHYSKEINDVIGDFYGELKNEQDVDQLMNEAAGFLEELFPNQKVNFITNVSSIHMEQSVIAHYGQRMTPIINKHISTLVRYAPGLEKVL